MNWDVEFIPELAREILGNGGLDMGWNVARQEDRLTTLVHGIRLMVEADGVVDDNEEEVVRSFTESGLSMLAKNGNRPQHRSS